MSNKTIPNGPGRKPTTRESFQKLVARIDALEKSLQHERNPLHALEAWVDFTFERAIWELPALSALSSQYDQAARREQLGYLHAAVTVNEKLGRETPEQIGRMVMALAGDKVTEVREPVLGAFDGSRRYGSGGTMSVPPLTTSTIPMPRNNGGV